MTRAPSLQSGMESSQPAPARPTGSRDPWLGTPRPGQQAGHPPATSHALALAPGDARVPVRSSNCLACSVASTVGGDKTGDATKGRGDRVRFAYHSPTTSALAARFCCVGTTARLSASHSSSVDVAAGSRRSAEVTTTSRLPWGPPTQARTRRRSSSP